MPQVNALPPGFLKNVNEIKVLLDEKLSIHILNGETKTMTMLPAGYKPDLMQIYGDGELLHESRPQDGIITINRLTAA